MPQRGAVPPIAASCVYSTYTYGFAGKFGSSASPSSPRSQKLWTLVRRSANTSRLVSDERSKTLIIPLFSATKTRPSGAKRTAVGLVSPENTVRSENPGG